MILLDEKQTKNNNSRDFFILADKERLNQDFFRFFSHLSAKKYKAGDPEKLMRDLVFEIVQTFFWIFFKEIFYFRPTIQTTVKNLSIKRGCLL